MSQTGYRWWRDGPRLVRRFYWRMILLVVPIPVALITIGLFKDQVPRFGFMTLGAVLIAGAALMGVWVFAVGRWERRLVGQLQAGDYKLCPNCRFELAGHEGRFNCPECGTACDLDKVQAAWRSFRPRITGGSA